MALLEVPGDQRVAGGLEGGLNEARAGDDVAVLLALDVVVGIAEEVEQLAPLQAESQCRGLAAEGLAVEEGC